MSLSSLKGCWYKFSSRLRDYLDVVDSYYRPPSEEDLPDGAGGGNHHRHHSHHHHHHHHHSSCLQQPPTLDAKSHAACHNNRRIIRSTGETKENGGGGGSASGKRHGNRGAGGGAIGANPNKSHSHHHHKHCRAALSSPNTTTTTDTIAIKQQQHAKQATSSVAQVAGNNNGSAAQFSKRKTSQGQVYFVDGQGQKYWYDPSVPKELLYASLNLDSLVGCLRADWEVRHTSSGKTYYVNHERRTTQFTDPRLVQHKDYLMRILKHVQCGSKSLPSTNTTTTRPPLAPSTGNNSHHHQHRTTTTNTARQNPNMNSSSNTLANTSSTAAAISTTLDNSQNTHHQRQSSRTNSPLCPPFVNYLSHNHHQDTNTTANIHQHPTPPTKANRELFDKISILRQELLKQQVITHPCKIDISRKRIFEESFRCISQMQPRDLKKRLLVKFKGEEGLDYGGVAREWFYLLSREILNPVHGLFQYTSDDIYNLQINPDSGIVYREHLSYMNFCGRVIGMAVFHGHFIEGHFTLPFYKMLLKKSITLSDIELVDPELYRSLCWILENDITNVIDTTFLVQHNAFGQLQEHELKENGRNIVVTEENKHEYVSLYVNYRCRRGIANQFEALQRGFYELISPYLVENFDEHELELLIGGLTKINIEDWRLHTKLKNCTLDSPLVKWFWDIVKSYSEDKRARLLQFVTGSTRVPIQGFKALQGVNSELRLFTIHLIKNACTDNLPKSHTCFNRIDLPPYESYEKLRDKLTQAIEETMGFAMQ